MKKVIKVFLPIVVILLSLTFWMEAISNVDDIVEIEKSKETKKEP